MPSPIPTSLIVAYEGDGGSIFRDTGGTTLCSGVTDSARCWKPQTPGNSVGNVTFAGSDMLFHTDLFANNIPGIAGNGAGGVFQSASNLAALDWIDVFIVFKDINAPINFGRLIDAGFASGLALFRNGTLANRYGGAVRYSGTGTYVNCPDNVTNILHASWRSDTGLFYVEANGHVDNASFTGTASTTAAAPLCLLNDLAGDSGSGAAISTLFIYSRSNLLPSSDVNTVLRYLAGPTRYNRSLAGMPATGFGANVLAPLSGVR